MDISIIIPTYNEEKNIESVVRHLHEILQKAVPSFEIIVVDNGSTDDTNKLLSTLKKEIPTLVVEHIIRNIGYGNGILTGLSLAKGDVLGWIHADNQVDINDVIRTYNKLIEEDLDVCKGTRISRDEHFMRIIQSKIYNGFFNILFNPPCRDINGSPKLFKKSVYEKMDLQSRGWFIDPEMIIRGIRLGYKIGEVPIKWNSRQSGSSKVNIGAWLEFVKNMLAYKFVK